MEVLGKHLLLERRTTNPGRSVELDLPAMSFESEDHLWEPSDLGLLISSRRPWRSSLCHNPLYPLQGSMKAGLECTRYRVPLEQGVVVHTVNPSTYPTGRGKWISVS